MVKQVINVNYEGGDVGAVSFDTATGLGAFEYSAAFIAKGVELFGFYQNSSLDRTGGPSIADVDQFSVGSRIKF